jgi:hypothetical protein
LTFGETVARRQWMMDQPGGWLELELELEDAFKVCCYLVRNQLAMMPKKRVKAMVVIAAVPCDDELLKGLLASAYLRRASLIGETK